MKTREEKRTVPNPKPVEAMTTHIQEAAEEIAKEFSLAGNDRWPSTGAICAILAKRFPPQPEGGEKKINEPNKEAAHQRRNE